MTEKEKEGLRLIEEYHAGPDRKIHPAAIRAKQLAAEMSSEEKAASIKRFQAKITALRQDKRQ
jgi:hypothetical protein